MIKNIKGVSLDTSQIKKMYVGYEHEDPWSPSPKTVGSGIYVCVVTGYSPGFLGLYSREDGFTIPCDNKDEAKSIITFLSG